jgi:hypothetical protein
LKIQWEIHFLTFFKYWPKRSKKIFKIEIWTFSFQLGFQNQFSTSGSGQTENMQLSVFAYFQSDHFPKLFWKQIWNENVHISILKIFLERFGQYLKKSKNGFPIVFSKCDLARGGGGAKFVTEKIS